jgi:hypothetical protein
MTKDEALDKALDWYDSGHEDREDFQAMIENLLATPVQEPVASMSDEQDAFEKVFKLPDGITRFDGGYAATSHSAWSAQQNCYRWEGWKARSKLCATPPAARPAPVQEPAKRVCGLGCKDLGACCADPRCEAVATTPPAAQQQCKWPICQSEEYQQALAEQIKQELFTGAAQPAPVQEPVAWPCLIAEADFEQNTITLEMQCSDYKVGAGQHWLHTTPPAAQKPFVGLTEQERNNIEDYCEMIVGKPTFDAIEAKLKEKNT